MNTRFYQRALARDEDEATRLVEDSLEEGSLRDVFAQILIPALSFAKRDRARDAISDEDKRFVLDLTRELATGLADSDDESRAAVEPTRGVDGNGSEASQRVRVMACSARDEADAQALELLAQLIPREKIELEMLPAEMLSAEIVSHVEESRPTVVAIVSLPPGSIAQTRYLCKKLRAKSPELRIVVARWQTPSLPDEGAEPFLTAGADSVATTIEATIAEFLEWRGVRPAEIAESYAERAGDGPQRPVGVPS
jgi:hypothetical protein